MKRSIASVLSLMILGAATCAAQDTLRPRFGITGGLVLNVHSADFRALPGVPNCCPRFESGDGMGVSFGAGYEFPIAPSLLISLGAGYADHSALLSASEGIAIVSGGEVGSGTFEHTIDATITSIGVEPGIRYRLIDGLFLHGGARVGAVLSSAYAQKEEIAAPAGRGTFLDSLGNDSGLRTRNVNSGDIPEAASLLVQGVAGVEYELPLNAARTLLLVPGVSYTPAFTDLVSGSSWKANALRLSLGVKYSPPPSKHLLRDTIFIRDTTVVTASRDAAPGLRLDHRQASVERMEEGAFIVEHITITERYIRDVPKRSTLTSMVTALGVEDGREEKVATLRIEEFLRTNTHPLLGYLFFGEGSAEIPARYGRMTAAEADRFQPASLFGEDAMTISHNVLNIIGYNLRRYGDARLTITGCNSDNGVEKGDRVLSRGRASAVREYLIDVWGIAPDRLSIVERDLPAVPSNTRTADGSEENRRVEITSTTPEVTDAFVAHDTTRSANPPSLRIKPVVRSSEPVASWTLTVSQRGDMVKEFSGSGAPPSSIDWEIAADERNIPRFSEPLTIELHAVTSEGEQTTSTTTLATDVISVQRKEAEKSRDYRIEQYNLVLFDVGRSTITDAHHRTIQLVRSRLRPGSTITVEGYSDRTGEADPNRRLARARAQSTATALGRNDAKVVGVGEDRLLYDNNTPEGRFYCRTVRITVKTER